MTILLLHLLPLAFLTTPAIRVHDQWTNGQPVPAWIKLSCCGPNDAHHLRADQVHVVTGGYRVEGYGALIPYDAVLPSEDGEFWGFWVDLADGTQTRIYCFFAPQGGT